MQIFNAGKKFYAGWSFKFFSRTDRLHLFFNRLMLYRYALARNFFRVFTNVSTIYALATAPGKAGVGIIRLSGPESILTLKKLIWVKNEDEFCPRPRMMKMAKFYDYKGELLDKGMFVVFPGPNSFSGEDIVELHIHSAASVISGFFQTFSKLALNLAKPGEFIQRAWEHGKLDLLQVEAVADLLESETEEQRKFALGQMGNKKLSNWRNQLIDVLAMSEASIDFEEDDVGISNSRIPAAIQNLRESIANDLNNRYGEMVKDGLKVVISGPPNSGKSSLFNVLLKKNSAIVSPFPGTTRDILRGSINLQGHAVLVSDTAGLRESTNDPIELEGISRARIELRGS